MPYGANDSEGLKSLGFMLEQIITKNTVISKFLISWGLCPPTYTFQIYYQVLEPLLKILPNALCSMTYIHNTETIFPTLPITFMQFQIVICTEQKNTALKRAHNRL